MIILYIVEKPFSSLLFTNFITEEILKHIKDCFKINNKHRNTKPKKRVYVKFKNYESKIKPSIIIYAEFESTVLKPKSRRNLHKKISKIYCFK